MKWREIYYLSDTKDEKHRRMKIIRPKAFLKKVFYIFAHLLPPPITIIQAKEYNCKLKILKKKISAASFTWPNPCTSNCGAAVEGIIEFLQPNYKQCNFNSETLETNC